MNYSTGKLASIVMLAAFLSFVAAAWVAWRYRVAMRRLMSAPLPAAEVPNEPAAVAASAASAAPAALASNQRTEPWPVSPADNHRAAIRLALLLAWLSALMALSSAALQLHVVMNEPFSVRKLLVLGWVQLWPLIPSLGLLWRWSRGRVLGALLGWFVLCLALVLWRSTGTTPQAAANYLAFEIGPPMVLAGVVCMGGATRAIAPWLLLPMIGLVWASLTGLDTIWLMLPNPPGWFVALTTALGARTVMGLFTMLPWLLAWWPLKHLGRALARAHARHWLSELLVLFTAVWGLSLLTKALIAGSDMGWSAAVMLLPLGWIPLVVLWGQRQHRATGRPPTLLVLRVFQHDARIQALFDSVIERWRLTGNTVLIAGTDLLDRTLDAGDIYSFIDGSLAARFIHRAADVPQRLAAFDMQPDFDGRYRINECYCHDTTWQQALAALVEQCDVVLMDLRSFKSHNRGCAHELGVLAQARRLQRAVVLTDGDTDRAAAAESTRGAPAGRFLWLDTSVVDRAKRREVLHNLLLAQATTAPRPDAAAQAHA